MRISTGIKASIVSSLLALTGFAAAPADDKAFIDEAGASGIAEVKLSELAVTQSGDPEVKDFARKMIDEHSLTNDKLLAVCSGKVALPPREMSTAAKKRFAELSKIKGSKFDRAYLATMLDDHKKAVKLFEKEAAKGFDPDIRQFAGNTLPTLKHHLEMVLTLDRELRGRQASRD